MASLSIRARHAMLPRPDENSRGAGGKNAALAAFEAIREANVSVPAARLLGYADVQEAVENSWPRAWRQGLPHRLAPGRMANAPPISTLSARRNRILAIDAGAGQSRESAALPSLFERLQMA